MRKAALILSMCLLFGCGNPAAPLPSSAALSQLKHPPDFSWEQMTDLAGNKIEFVPGTVTGVDLNYCVGWTLNDTAYKIIRVGDEVGGCKVTGSRSSYTVWTWEDSPPTLVADINEYFVDMIDPLRGVLVLSVEHMVFHPYYREDGENFWLLCKMNDSTIQQFTARKSLIIDDGEPIIIQPIGVGLPSNSALFQKVCAAVTGNPDCDPDFSKTLTRSVVLDVTLSFEYIGVQTFSQGRGGGMWGTYAYAGFEKNAEEYVTINSVLGTTETDTAWVY